MEFADQIFQIPGSMRKEKVKTFLPQSRNDNPLQYSCLENSMDREAWQATVHGVSKSRTRLGNFTSLYFSAFNWSIPPPSGNINLVGQRLTKYVSKGVVVSKQRSCCTVAKSCPTLCDPMDRSMPGFPVLHHLTDFAQARVR